MEEKKKQERSVVHLEMDGKHYYYYGNLKALCDNWSKEEIGISYSVLRNIGVSDVKSFVNEQCVIRKGIIITSLRRSIKKSLSL